MGSRRGRVSTDVSPLQGIRVRIIPGPHSLLGHLSPGQGGSRRCPLARGVQSPPRPGRVVGVDVAPVVEGGTLVIVDRRVAGLTVTPSPGLVEDKGRTGKQGVQGDGREARESAPADTDGPPRDPGPTR